MAYLRRNGSCNNSCPVVKSPSEIGFFCHEPLDLLQAVAGRAHLAVGHLSGDDLNVVKLNLQFLPAANVIAKRST